MFPFFASLVPFYIESTQLLFYGEGMDTFLRQLVMLFSSSFLTSVLTCIIDGCDQSKFRLPKLKKNPSKLMSVLYRPALHVAACWSHGISLDVYVCPDDLKKDTNCQSEMLFLSLGSVLERCSNQLPPGLHVQMDNCPREGKNQYFLTTLVSLVIQGQFRWTAAAFLRTGHSSLDGSSNLFLLDIFAGPSGWVYET